jgi:hypothetical protein
MNITGVRPEDFRLDPRSKLKRTRPQVVTTAGTSYESQNYFAVLSDTDSDTETAESITPPPPVKPKERIPRIVLYSYLTNHSQTLKTLNEKLNSPVEIKTKTNRLLLYTKTVTDYELVLREIKTAKLAYHTYPLPNKQKPRLTLKGIPPNVETE